MTDNQIVPRRHNDPALPAGRQEEKLEEEDKKPGMVVEETEDTENRSRESAAEPEESEENPQESGGVFGTRDFSLSSFGDSPSNKKRIILILLVVLVGVGLIAGGIWVYNSKVKPAAVAPSPQLPSPSPTPKVKVDVSVYKTRVLNGSGTPGKAGTIKDMLEKERFEEVATGNAKSFDYKETEVSMKASVPPAVFEKIKEVLSDYQVIQGDALEDSNNYDVIVIVGATE